MEQLIYWVRVDGSGLGRPQLLGDVPTNSMAVPMMLLCLVQQLTEGRDQEVVEKYKELSSWCVQQVLQHIQVWTCFYYFFILVFLFVIISQSMTYVRPILLQRNGTAILENVSPDGAELPGCQGRLQNPGKHWSSCSHPDNHKKQREVKMLTPTFFCPAWPFLRDPLMLTQAMHWKQAGSCFSAVRRGRTRSFRERPLTNLWSCLINVVGIKSMVAYSTSWMWMVTVPHK